ncbi:hypothetical protein [Halogeometricum borinquense]|uniref:hypothetical protein n=1 Tax=Halogeometricum borinquense TaxID=60847 RepID=UPI003449F182
MPNYRNDDPFGSTENATDTWDPSEGEDPPSGPNYVGDEYDETPSWASGGGSPYDSTPDTSSSDSGGVPSGGNTGGGGVIVNDRNDDDEDDTVTYDPTTGDDGASDGTLSGGGGSANVEIGDDGEMSYDDGDGFVSDDGVDADGDGSTTTSGGSSSGDSNTPSNGQTPTVPEMPGIPTEAFEEYQAQIQAQMQSFTQAMNQRLASLNTDTDTFDLGGPASIVAAFIGLVVVLLGVLSMEG